jgi:dihydroorotate dehydrogenase
MLLEYELDGIIATNTTIARDAIINHPLAQETGGLSGKPLRDKSTEVVRSLARFTNGRIPIIASGGIMSATDAKEKFAAGASLVQLYSGLIYQGPKLIKETVSSF